MYLALDLATCTGFCFGAPDTGELPAVGHIRLPKTGEDVGSFLIAFEDWLTSKVREVGPSLLLFEAPILASSATPHVTRKLHALAGITEMVAVRAAIECCEVYPVTVKKALTGSGRADKDDMVRAARTYGFNPAVPDEADAFGLWLHAVKTRFPRDAGRWDPLNFTAGRARMNIFAKVSRAEFTRLWEACLSGTQIGDRLGISETSVRSIRKSFGLGDRRRGNALHTPETVEHVKRLWLENKSASNIARLMGPTWTRNMVIGMVHRHGFSEGRKTNAKPGAAAKTAKVKPVREPRPPKPPKPSKAAAPQPFDLSKSKSDSTAEQRAEKAAAGRLIIKRTIDAANDNSVPMVGRSFGQCAWPVGMPARAADQLACGAPVYQGIEKCSYCLDHARRAFARDITQPKPKENLERANRWWAA